jgi:hypothetical protein
VIHLTDILKYDPYIEREDWKRTKRWKRQEGGGICKEVKELGKNSKPNNPRFSQRKDIAAMPIECS